MSKTPRKPRTRATPQPEEPLATDPLLKDAVIEEPEELPQPIVQWQPTHAEAGGEGVEIAPPRALSAGAGGALAVGAIALAGFTMGALAVGAVAVGAMAIGRLNVGQSRFKRLEIDHLVVGKVSALRQRPHRRRR